MNKRFGFTLAEVLITLAIIGVVAAMTIPTLLQNQAKKQYVTQLKKAYTAFTQATQLVMIDEGVTKLADMNFVEASSIISDAEFNKFADKFKTVKKCLQNDTKCDYRFNAQGGINPDENIDVVATHKFITADGILFGFVLDAAGMGYSCKSGYSAGTYASTNKPLDTACMPIIIDVNGPKKPNRSGRDIFYFYILNDGNLYPVGGQSDIDCGMIQCNGFPSPNGYWKTAGGCSTQANGTITSPDSCSARIMEESWEMKY